MLLDCDGRLVVGDYYWDGFGEGKEHHILQFVSQTHFNVINQNYPEDSISGILDAPSQCTGLMEIFGDKFSFYYNTETCAILFPDEPFINPLFNTNCSTGKCLISKSENPFIFFGWGLNDDEDFKILKMIIHKK